MNQNAARYALYLLLIAMMALLWTGCEDLAVDGDCVGQDCMPEDLWANYFNSMDTTGDGQTCGDCHYVGSAHDAGNAPGLWLDSRANAYASLTNPPDHAGCETQDWLGSPSLLIATLDSSESDHGQIVSASADVCMPTDLTITDCQASGPSGQVVQLIRDWIASLGG